MTATIRFAFAASMLALAACQPATPPAGTAEAPTAETAQAEPAETGCNVHVDKAWIDQETPVRRYFSEASVLGPSCEQGVAVLVIRQREGTPIYAWSGLTTFLFGLNEAKDPAAMKAALLDWIDQASSTVHTTADLPPWEETDGQPKRTEFPFMPAEWFDKAAWEALKAEKLDVFCFPQGMESLNCSVLRPGQGDAPTGMEEIGLQLFPG